MEAFTLGTEALDAGGNPAGPATGMGRGAAEVDSSAPPKNFGNSRRRAGGAGRGGGRGGVGAGRTSRAGRGGKPRRPARTPLARAG